MAMALRPACTAPLVYAAGRYARGADELFSLISDEDLIAAASSSSRKVSGMPGKVSFFEARAHWG
jgi:hypothetical protein